MKHRGEDFLDHADKKALFQCFHWFSQAVTEEIRTQSHSRRGWDEGPNERWNEEIILHRMEGLIHEIRELHLADHSESKDRRELLFVRLVVYAMFGWNIIPRNPDEYSGEETCEVEVSVPADIRHSDKSQG